MGQWFNAITVKVTGNIIRKIIMKTKLAILLRQYNQGLLTFDEYYHAIGDTLVGDKHD
jgi:hypothetical protein